MGWPKEREPYGHGATVVVDGRITDPFAECRRTAYRAKGGR